MVKNTYGLDLGSYEIKVYDKKKDTIWKEKNVIAIRDQREIFAVGDTAYEMYQKAPANIEVIFSDERRSNLQIQQHAVPSSKSVEGRSAVCARR